MTARTRFAAAAGAVVCCASVSAEAPKVSRRLIIKQIGAAAAGTAATLAHAGCASLPVAGDRGTVHPCDHVHCGYFQRVGGSGRCSLVVRVSGGRP